MTQASDLKAASYLNRLVDLTTPSLGTAAVYRQVEPQVKLMASVYLALPKNNPLAAETPEGVLNELISPFKIISGLAQMMEASDAVTTAFGVYLTNGRRTFADLVGPDTLKTSDIKLIFTSRRDDEIAEQKALVKKVVDYTKMHNDSAKDLAITVVDAAPLPVPTPAEAKKKSLNIFERLLTVEVKPANQTGTAPAATALLSWQTKPVLDETYAEELDLLQKIYGWLNVRNVSPAVVKTTLKDTYNLDDAGLTKMYSKLAYGFKQQALQSQTILDVIEKDFKLYQGCLEAALELQTMLVEIGNFFGYQVGKAAAPAGKPAPGTKYK